MPYSSLSAWKAVNQLHRPAWIRFQLGKNLVVLYAINIGLHLVQRKRVGKVVVGSNSFWCRWPNEAIQGSCLKFCYGPCSPRANIYASIFNKGILCRHACRTRPVSSPISASTHPLACPARSVQVVLVWLACPARRASRHGKAGFPSSLLRLAESRERSRWWRTVRPPSIEAIPASGMNPLHQ